MTEELFTSQLHKKHPLLIVISGPSGIGKDTIVQALQQRNPSFHFVITCASRDPRPGEVNGVDYIFVSKERFEEMIAEDELIEYALVYHEYKGVPRQHVIDALNSGSDVIMRLDVQGAARIRSLFPEAVLVFLAPENDEEWIKRLQNRKTETAEKLKLRIATAKDELRYLDIFDYFVVNARDQIDQTVECILSIIQAEHHRRPHREVSL